MKERKPGEPPTKKTKEELAKLKGRRTRRVYTDDERRELKERFIEHVAAGNPITHWAGKPGNFSRGQLQVERLKDPEFSRRVLEAQEIAQDFLLDDCIDIADDGARYDKTNLKRVERDKLRIAARHAKAARARQGRSWSGGEPVTVNILRFTESDLDG